MKDIKVFYDKNIPYDHYIEMADFLRKKRWESVIFCEHPPVITAGIQYKKESFRFPLDWIQKQGVEIFYVNRGGDVTAHEPNQIIIYPHIDLQKRKIPLTDFIHILIEITQKLIHHIFDIHLVYQDSMPGLYTELGEKVVSIGLEIRKKFTSSGIAINYTNTLETFRYIYPCGYKNLHITTIKDIVTEKNHSHYKYKIDDHIWKLKKIDFCKKWVEEFFSYLYCLR